MTKKLLLLCRGGGYDEDEEERGRDEYLLYNNNSNIGTPQHNAVIRHQNFILYLFFFLFSSASISSARVEISKFSGGVVGEVVV